MKRRLRDRHDQSRILTVADRDVQTTTACEADVDVGGPDAHRPLYGHYDASSVGIGRDRWDKARIVVQSLKSGASKTVLEGGSDARYLPTGHLLYVLGGIVHAVAFDLKRLEVYGPCVPMVEGVRRSASGLNGAASFSVSSTGSLAYIPGPISAMPYYLTRADRIEGATLLPLPPGNYFTPRSSPDGKRLAFGTEDGKEAIVFTYDLEDGPLRLLTYGGNNRFPIWSADSARVAFQSNRQGDLGIWWQPVVGRKAERLTKAEPGTSHVPESLKRRTNKESSIAITSPRTWKFVPTAR